MNDNADRLVITFLKLMSMSCIAAVAFSLAYATVQTETSYARLTQSPVSIRGEKFDSIVSVEETLRPPGGGVEPAIIGPAAVDIDYVINAQDGTISAAPGRADFWAKVVYRWDDTPSPEQQEIINAESDCNIQRPALRNRIMQDLADLAQEETRAQEILAQMQTQVAAFASDPALPASPTAAQLRSAIVTLATRDAQVAAGLRDAAQGAQRNIDRTRGLARLIACQAGIDLP